MSFLLALSLFISSETFSQESLHAWSTFRREQGLLHNYVTAIDEGPDGSIWYGTAYGVSRYDGVSWTHHTEASGMPGALVTHLMVDGQGRVWAASGDGFPGFRRGWVAYLEGDRWVTVTLGGDRRRLLVGELFELNGSVAIGTRGGGLFVEVADGFKRLTVRDGLNSNDIECTASLPDGSQIVIHGLRGPGAAPDPSRRAADGTWSSWVAGPLSGVDVISAKADGGGRIWFGTQNDGLWMYDAAAGSGAGEQAWVNFSTEHGLPSNTIEVLEGGKVGQIWVGTPMGVALWQPETNRFESFTEKDALPEQRGAGDFERAGRDDVGRDTGRRGSICPNWMGDPPHPVRFPAVSSTNREDVRWRALGVDVRGTLPRAGRSVGAGSGLRVTAAGFRPRFRI